MDDFTHPFIQSIEHGHTGHGEILIRYNPASPDHIMKVQGMLSREANKTAIEGRFGVPHHVWSDALHDMYGPHVMNYHLLLRKIKKSFDPNQASEASNYITQRKRRVSNKVIPKRGSKIGEEVDKRVAHPQSFALLRMTIQSILKLGGKFMLLKDRVAIITGGARGMGRAIALRFAKEGCSSVIADLLDKDGEKTVADIKKAGKDAIYVHSDVTKSASVKDMVAKVHRQIQED